MHLKENQAKLDFTKTRESSGETAQRAYKLPIFVAQEHQASIHRFAFRLVADGVPKNLSVPKGPLLDPPVKRSETQVDAHPTGCTTFDSTILQDQYGGGTIAIRGRGTYKSVGQDKLELRRLPRRSRMDGSSSSCCASGSRASSRTSNSSPREGPCQAGSSREIARWRHAGCGNEIFSSYIGAAEVQPPCHPLNWKEISHPSR